MRAALVRALAPHRSSILVTILYVLLSYVFEQLTSSAGLVTPRGALNLPVVACGLAVIGLRVLVVFVVPALVTYRSLAGLTTPAAVRKSDTR